MTRQHHSAMRPQRLRPDSVIARGVAVLVQNPLHFGGAAALVFVTPAVLLMLDVPTVADHLGGLVSMAFGSVVAGAIETTVLGTILTMLTFMPVGPLGEDTIGLVIALVWVLAQILYACVVIVGVAEEMDGNEANMADMTVGGLRVVVPAFLVAMVVGTLAGVVAISPNAVFGPPGLLWQILRMIPAMIVIVFFWVAVPAAAVEELGAVASLKRGWILARGNRLRILAVMLILFMIGLALGAVVIISDLAWLGAVLMVVMTGVNASVLAVAFHDLREIAGDRDDPHIGQVFD